MDIAKLRKTIDQIDHEILGLLAKRRDVVMEIGSWKKEHGVPARDDTRWNEVLTDRQNIGKEMGIPSDVVASIWEQIHEWALEIEDNQ